MLKELGVEVTGTSAAGDSSGQTTDLAETQPTESEPQQEDLTYGNEELAELLKLGADWSTITKKDYLAFGVTLESASSIDVASAAQANGFTVDYYSDLDTYFGYQPRGALAFSVSGSQATGGDNNPRLSYSLGLGAASGDERPASEANGYPVGTHGICFGDSPATVLSKLGFSNADEIVRYCNVLVEELPEEGEDTAGTADSDSESLVTIGIKKGQGLREIVVSLDCGLDVNISEDWLWADFRWEDNVLTHFNFEVY